MFLQSLFTCLFTITLTSAANPGWAALNVTVAEIMSDVPDYIFSQVEVLFGTPPQQVEITINLSGDLLAAWSVDCLYCPGSKMFDASASSTIKNGTRPWPKSDFDFRGTYKEDSISLGGMVGVQSTEFVVIDAMSSQMGGRINNGHLGLYVNATDDARRSRSVLTRLWEEGALLNPVIGLRLDPLKPRLTVGALDPSDYEGTINWVPMEIPSPSKDFLNAVKIDGIKGYNGSFLPFGDGLFAELNSLARDVYVPPSNPYATNADYTGPFDLINLYPTGGFGLACDDSFMPHVPLTVTINGVDYRVESKDLVHPHSGAAATGYCNVALKNTTIGAAANVVLGQPFLRSVYLAYRFPTDNCPGFYGFAFPSGANRTQSEIDQKPRSSPSQGSQCLAITLPTTMPVLSHGAFSGKTRTTGSLYEVYGRPGDGQVPLLGADELIQTVWGSSK